MSTKPLCLNNWYQTNLLSRDQIYASLFAVVHLSAQVVQN